MYETYVYQSKAIKRRFRLHQLESDESNPYFYLLYENLKEQVFDSIN